jgi:hypothetical protein
MTAIDPAAITTNTDNALVVVTGINTNEDVADASAPSGYSNFLAKNTENTSTTEGATSRIASKRIATAGSENPGTFGGTFSVNVTWRSATFVLRDASYAAAAAGEGAVTLGGAALAADGTAAPPVSGSAIITLPAPALNASALMIQPATGVAAIVLQGAVVSGYPVAVAGVLLDPVVLSASGFETAAGSAGLLLAGLQIAALDFNRLFVNYDGTWYVPTPSAYYEGAFRDVSFVAIKQNGVWIPLYVGL